MNSLLHQLPRCKHWNQRSLWRPNIDLDYKSFMWQHGTKGKGEERKKKYHYNKFKLTRKEYKNKIFYEGKSDCINHRMKCSPKDKQFSPALLQT
jgi:hypothetical protein